MVASVAADAATDFAAAAAVVDYDDDLVDGIVFVVVLGGNYVRCCYCCYWEGDLVECCEGVVED